MGAPPALAHGLPNAGAPGWHAEWWLVVLLFLSLALYGMGAVRLWRHAGAGSGLTYSRAAAFLAGWSVLAVALASPLDGIAAQLFTAHMVQHELLMVAAAPLLVLGRPLAAWLWALPAHARAEARSLTHARPVRRPWHAITSPFGAFAIHTAAIWIWHVPGLFRVALAAEPIHMLQHASFLFSALLFWWAMLGRSQPKARGGVAVVYLFVTMMHTGALGALLTLSTKAWYGSDAAAAALWGMTPLEDQQLGGLVMWIPAGTTYIIAALWAMARWIAGSGLPTGVDAGVSTRAS